MPKAFFWSQIRCRDGRMSVAEHGFGFGREKIHVQSVEDKLEELGDEARIGRMPGQPQPGPVEQAPQIFQAVAFAFMAIELELQPHGGADLGA